MSRRKQANPRSLKITSLLEESKASEDLQMKSEENEVSSLIDESNVLNETQVKIEENDEAVAAARMELCRSPSLSDTNDSIDSDVLGTDGSSSWRSETPPTPATTGSGVELTEEDLTFTVGATESTPYACHFCNKAFSRLNYLKKHEQSHSDQMPFRCEWCSRLFKHKRSRDRHVKLHTGDKKYRCAHCEAAFSRSDHLKIHLRTHDNGKPFQCVVCNRGYNTAAALTSHIQNHKKQQAQPQPQPQPSETITSTSNAGNGDSQFHEDTKHECLHCSKIFTSLQELEKHETNSHVPESDSDKQVEIFTRSETESITPKLACIYCAQDTFNTMEELQNHVESNHKAIINGDIQTSSSPTLQKPFATTSASSPSQSSLSVSSQLSCNLCTMRFMSYQNLQMHILTSHKIFNFTPQAVCSYCSLPFRSIEMFAEHCAKVHRNKIIANIPEQIKPTDLSKKTYNDDKMAKRIKKNEDMLSSSSSTPTPTPTPTNTNTNSHYDHFGLFLCNQCDAGLPDFESFRSHLKLHIEHSDGMKNNVEQRNFMIDMLKDSMLLPCPHCGQTFNDLAMLERHICAHYFTPITEYMCRSCSKTFPKADDLQNHLLDAHAYHLYRCSLCREMFDSKVAIQVHFAVKHSSECQMLRCLICPSDTRSVFRTEKASKIHIRTNHDSSIFMTPLPTAVGKPLRCSFCIADFDSEIDLQIHLAVHFEPFKCTICNKSFQVEYLLECHMQECHEVKVSNGLNEVDSNHGLDTVKTKTDIPFSLSGAPNNKQLHQVETSSSHLESPNCKSNSCDICDRNDFSESELIAHRKLVHHIKPTSKNGVVSLHCAYCNENFKSRTELENHMKNHSQSSGVSGKHKCNICDELCPSAAVLAEHKLTHCKLISANSCTHCKAVLSTDDQFYSHFIKHCGTNNTSNNTNNQISLPTPCVICRQTLMSNIELRIHARFHLRTNNVSNEYQCVLCLKNFDKPNVIVANENSNQCFTYICRECYTHHSLAINFPDQKNDFKSSKIATALIDSGNNNKYSCLKCQLSFETECQVQNHVTSHLLNDKNNQYICHLCRSKLSSEFKLQIHLIEHTFVGFGSYTCYICSTVFTASQGLYSHMLEHGLAARPYDCPRCSSKFFFRAELDNHSFSHMEHDSLLRQQSDVDLLSVVSGPGGYDHLLDQIGGYEKTSSPSNTSKSTFCCNECPITFPDIISFLNHVKTHGVTNQENVQDTSTKQNTMYEYTKQESKSMYIDIEVASSPKQNHQNNAS